MRHTGRNRDHQAGHLDIRRGITGYTKRSRDHQMGHQETLKRTRTTRWDTRTNQERHQVGHYEVHQARQGPPSGTLGETLRYTGWGRDHHVGH